MRVVSIGTYDLAGGAARAAHRQHEALRGAGVDHQMLVGKKSSSDPFVFEAPPMPRSYIRSRKAALIRQFAIERNRTSLSDTWFSFPLRDTGIAALELVRNADVINVHWCSGFLSLNGLDELFTLGKPVVLTLHDQWAFTGGCHYTAGCEGYLRDCSACPQLATDPVGVPATTLRLRRELARARTATVVSPSRWMHRTASESAVLSGWRHERIPNALNTDVFIPQSRAQARASLGLASEPWWILFVSERVAERRKGFRDLLSAAARLEAVSGRPVHFLALGAKTDVPSELAARVEFTGKLDDEREVVAAYSAADVLVLPSYEDNLPNTMVEALSCGTPVVGYQTGGLPDLIRTGESGVLVRTGDVGALCDALGVLLASGASESLRTSCRQLAVRECSYSAHAAACISLYEELLPKPSSKPTTAPRTDYDSPLWDDALKLLLDRLEVRPEFTREEKITIMAGRLEINRLLDSRASNPTPNGWNWT